MSTKIAAARARAALQRAHDLIGGLEARYPGVWDLLERLRANPVGTWSDWCLLPMAAHTAVATSYPGVPLIAHTAAFDA